MRFIFRSKKAAYDFIDLLVFLLFSIVIFSVILLSLSIDQPKFYPNLNADSLVTMMIYSQNSIFTTSSSIEETSTNILTLSDLSSLDSKYYGNKINDFVAAKLYVIDNNFKKTSQDFYYNFKFYNLWEQSEQVSVSKFRYNIPLKYTIDKNDNMLKDGILVIWVYSSHQKPYSVQQ